MKTYMILISCVLLIGGVRTDEDMVEPEQVHLSLGPDDTQITVTWVTQSPTNFSFVEIGQKEGKGVKLTRRVNGTASVYQDFGDEKRIIYIHRVTVDKLKPDTQYYYHVGCSVRGWSGIYWFSTFPQQSSYNSPTMLIYGDMGNKNARAMSSLQEEILTGDIDVVLHVGDFAYDMADDNGRRGDEFMRQIEPIAAYVPYQVCPGNHEYHYNFSNYDARFSMYNQQSKSINNFYHSFNVGPIHIVSISSEMYFYLQFGYKQIEYQYNWLIQDLEEANKPENRAKHPWIFLMYHRPMYCTNNDIRDCSDEISIMRSGLPMTGQFALEPLLKKYGVDMTWTGHQHSYERLWPVYQSKVENGTNSSPYVNPIAPVHIVTGSPGNQEDLVPFGDDPKGISAFHIDEYSYTKFQMINRTHILIQQKSAETPGKIIDSVTVVKDTGDYPLWMQNELDLSPYL